MSKSAISTSSPVLLSEVASTIEYYQVGDDKYPITDVVAVEGGFIVLNQPKLYLYRQGKKRKRVGLKTEYNDWKDYISGKNLFYDKATTKLYGQTKKINPETGLCQLVYRRITSIRQRACQKILFISGLTPNPSFTDRLCRVLHSGNVLPPFQLSRKFVYPGSNRFQSKE